MKLKYCLIFFASICLLAIKINSMQKSLCIKKIITQRGFSDNVNCCVLSHNNKFMVTAADNNLAMHLEHEGLTHVARITDKWGLCHELIGHRKPIRAIDISADDSIIVTGADDKRAYVWKYDDNKQEWIRKDILKGHKNPITAVAISQNDRDQFIITGSEDRIKIWNLDGNCLKKIRLNYCQNVSQIIVSKDSSFFITIHTCGKAYIHKLLDNKVIELLFFWIKRY